MRRNASTSRATTPTIAIPARPRVTRRSYAISEPGSQRLDDRSYDYRARPKLAIDTRSATLVRETSMASKIRRSSGNVFTDLGFPAEEALNLVVRADLMIAITKIIESRKLSQAKAAALFEVSQPR